MPARLVPAYHGIPSDPMIPILLALAYTAMDQGEWWMGLGVVAMNVPILLGRSLDD